MAKKKITPRFEIGDTCPEKVRRNTSFDFSHEPLMDHFSPKKFHLWDGPVCISYYEKLCKLCGAFYAKASTERS